MAGILRCKRCFAPIEEEQKKCNYCGMELKKTKVIRNGKKEVVSEEITEEDVEILFKQLEERIEEERKRTEKRKTYDEMTLDELIQAMR